MRMRIGFLGIGTMGAPLANNLRKAGYAITAWNRSAARLPPLGSRPAAEKAQLVVVAGGPAAARERARPALHAISARLFELDDAVQAALMKLVVNSVGGAMVTALAEALALGASGGLALPAIIETLQASSFHSPIYLMKGEQIVSGDWSPRFALALAEKDQRLAQEAAKDQGARLVVNDAVRRLFSEAIERGRGDKDLCAVAEVLLEQVKKR